MSGRRFGKKRRYAGRKRGRSYSRRRGGKTTVARTVNKMLSRVKEVKTFDVAVGFSMTTAYTPVPYLSDSGLILLNAVPPGTTFFNRIGRKINMKSLNLHYRIYKDVNNTPHPAMTIRVMLLLDKQANGIKPTADILLNGQVVATAGPPPTYSQNVTGACPSIYPPSRDRFKVLMDKWHTFAAAGLPSNTATLAYADNTGLVGSIVTKKYFKLKQLPVHYKDDGIDIGSIQTNALYFVCFVVGTDATDYGFKLALNSRLRFDDI